MVDAIAICAATGGFVTLAFAFVALYLDWELKRKVRDTANDAASLAHKSLAQLLEKPDDARLGAAQTSVPLFKDLIDALANFADKLSKLSQAVAALVVALALFALAALVVTVDDAVEEIDDDQPPAEASADWPSGDPALLRAAE